MVTPDADLEQFGAEVKKARTGKGWTLDLLAHKAFGNQDRKGFVSQIENGKRKLSALTIQKLHKVLNLPQPLIDRLLGLPLPAEDSVSPQEAEAEALIAQQSAVAERLKLSEALVIALAYKYAEGNPADFDGALKGLERALETAAEERARGRLPGNVSAAVEAVIARADALNTDGRVDEAAAELARLDAEHKDEINRLQAARLRLLDKRIAQTVLTRDVAGAVALELDRLTLENGGFDDLRSVMRNWFDRGRDKGLRFDLEVSVGLAEASLTQARTGDARGAALNDLGNALATLGERSSGTDHLDQAVTAYRRALEERTRDRVPLDWAMTQNNLGTALQTLGERSSGTDHLDQAVTAYRRALEERTRDRVPLQWAITQHCLSGLELVFFDTSKDECRLDAALAHATGARDVYVEAGADHYVQWIDNYIKAITKRRAELRA